MSDREFSIDTEGFYIGQWWVYPATNEIYEIRGFTKMKVGSQEWVDGVRYHPTSDSGKSFTRDMETFRKKFVLWEEK